MSGSQSVDRALSLLALFEDGEETLTIERAALALGVHRSTASRLLAALERGRMLSYDPAARCYRLGLGLLPLAGRVLNRFPVRAAATEILRELRDETGETAWIGVAAEDEVIFVDQASSPHIHTHRDWIGLSQPLAAGVTGRLLLAMRTPGERQGDEPSELTRARRQGFLARARDPVSGHAAVAAPISDHAGVVVAAVSASGPTHRVPAERLRRELVPATKLAALRISERLGAGVT